MSGVVTTGNYPNAMRPGVYKFWGLNNKEHPQEYKQLFDIEKSEKSYEIVVEGTGYGLAPVKSEGSKVKYDSDSQGFTTRATHVTYALGVQVTQEEGEDNLYAQVSKKRTARLAFSMRTTKEINGANIYNRASNSSFTYGDGVSLLSDSHPTFDGAQSNKLTVAADLSEASIEDLSIQIHKATDTKGLPIALRPKCLVIPSDLHYDATRVVKSTLQNDTANNAINVLYAENEFPEGIKLNHYLTNSKQWFIRTQGAPGEGLICFDRIAMSLTDDNDFDTTNAKFMARERYSFTVADWRSLYGSEGEA